MLTDEELEVNRKPETLPILYGIEYIFVGMDMKKNMPERLHNRIEGYFTFDFQHARWGIVTVRFKRIPEEEILLKNYKG